MRLTPLGGTANILVIVEIDVVVSLNDEDVILLFLPLLFAVCVIDFVVFFLWLIAKGSDSEQVF